MELVWEYTSFSQEGAVRALFNQLTTVAVWKFSI